MASLSLPLSTTISSSSRPTFLGKPPCLSTCSSPSNDFKVSCNATNNREETSQGSKFDRRNLLLGMGGLYGGATNLVSPDAPPSLATPISTPERAQCFKGTNLNARQPLKDDCCPPPSDKAVKHYELPKFEKTRVRPAAHQVTDDYIAKYELGTQLMRDLPADDPCNFLQQANVHCAYCNLAYDLDPDPVKEKRLQIHFSWLFFPWHRWYLYFYERILAKLIGDDTFALPYWQWDDSQPIPAMYAKHSSPLYDSKRNQARLPAEGPFPLANLKFASESSPVPADIVDSNKEQMRLDMKFDAELEDFYGGDIVNPSAGSVERSSHTAIHRWVGDPREHYGEDMGNFYSAGRDPLFFAHHANVDRLWSIWRRYRGEKPKDFTESDWLHTSFLFYDENGDLVRVKVTDALEDDKMGYTFQNIDAFPNWLDTTVTRKKRVKRSTTAAKKAPVTRTNFPVKLDNVIRVLVDRPKQMKVKDKEKGKELLVIEGIEVDSAKFVRFEVFVNDKDDAPGDVYAGCYSQLPHKNAGIVTSKIRLGLTELLQDLNVEEDDQILVSLKPIEGGKDVTIGGVKIIYV